MLSNLLDMSDKMLGIVDKLMNIFSKFSGGSQQSLKPEGSNTAPVEAVDPVKDVSSSPASTPKSTYSSSASNSKPASSTKYESKSPKV